jgi:alcohol oxidase
MKPREKGGVLDERLNVYGVQGLKVAGMLLVKMPISCHFLHILFQT